jgi:hypothetical protein
MSIFSRRAPRHASAEIGGSVEGQALVEYSLILVLVVITCIVVVTQVGDIVENDLWGLTQGLFG